MVCEKFDEPCICRISRCLRFDARPLRCLGCLHASASECSAATLTLPTACRVLERLGHLEILSLAGNQLPSLPPGLFTLKRLQLVDLSDNCLTELQPDIAALQELQVLIPPGLVRILLHWMLCITPLMRWHRVWNTSTDCKWLHTGPAPTGQSAAGRPAPRRRAKPARSAQSASGPDAGGKPQAQGSVWVLLSSSSLRWPH